MKTVHVGIDNGTSGSIGILCGHKAEWFKMPVRKELSYTKAKKYINRVDVNALRKILEITSGPTFATIERPMVNPGRFAATLSAMRCLEATLIVIEQLGIPYSYIDSREWQKTQLPSGLAGDELKQASLDIGRRLWPNLSFKPDADALLIARHQQQKNP